jgi:hypothetical protein
MNDYIAKAMAHKGQIRVYAAVTTRTVEKARTLHKMNPTPIADEPDTEGYQSDNNNTDQR